MCIFVSVLWSKSQHLFGDDKTKNISTSRCIYIYRQLAPQFSLGNRALFICILAWHASIGNLKVGEQRHYWNILWRNFENRKLNLSIYTAYSVLKRRKVHLNSDLQKWTTKHLNNSIIHISIIWIPVMMTMVELDK
jgi:hypothetical protein